LSKLQDVQPGLQTGGEVARARAELSIVYMDHLYLGTILAPLAASTRTQLCLWPI